MSPATRSYARALGFGLATNGIVQRMVKLPRNILGTFSRAMNQGIDLIGRRNNTHNHHHQHQNMHSQLPFQGPPMVQEEWAFLARYEQQYGPGHPFFYACRFAEALGMARDEGKLVFVYLHDPDHPYTPSFCRETLGAEVVVQFLDSNFVSWGALCGGGEGMHMAAALGASGFPFCAVVAPAPGDNLAVLRQMEGPVTAAELVEILQRAMEEQGPAFGRPQLEQKRQADRGLRAEQDAAYLAALKIDQEKERLQKKSSSLPKPVKSNETSRTKQANRVKQSSISAETSKKTNAEASKKTESSGAKKGEVTQILIRFPNGERREQSFVSTDKVRAIFGYINSLGLVGDGNYRLISNFPKKVYGVDEMGMSLKAAGLHPKASLFLEIL